MAYIPIKQPFIIAEAGSNQTAVQKDAVPETASSSWLPQSLCYTSGTGASTVLNVCLSAAVLCYGMSPDAARSAGAASPADITLKPPQSLYGLNHYPFDLRDRIIEMNIASSSASGATIGLSTAPTWAGGTPAVALAPGQQYGIVRPTSGTYAGYQLVNIQDTSTKLVEIVALAPGQLTTDYNPRVWVKIIPTLIQG